jgi:hypothetical protein
MPREEVASSSLSVTVTTANVLAHKNRDADLDLSSVTVDAGKHAAAVSLASSVLRQPGKAVNAANKRAFSSSLAPMTMPIACTRITHHSAAMDYITTTSSLNHPPRSQSSTHRHAFLFLTLALHGGVRWRQCQLGQPPHAVLWRVCGGERQRSERQ